jgi:PAS domain S-box-containing protein
MGRLLREILGKAEQFQFTVQTAETLAAGLACLAAGPVDVLLLDLSLPDSRGLDTVVRVRRQFPDVPIVVHSGHDDERTALAAVKLGAQDYLVKGQADARLIVRSIRYAMERKRTDDALARERDLLHGILNNIPDRIYFKDSASRFVRVNQAMADKFGLATPEAAAGKTDFDFHPAADAREFFADEQRLLQSGEPIINKVEGQTAADGSPAWASVTKVPMRDQHGRVTGLIGISRDISALKRLEASLVEERSLLRNLVDHLPDYIYVLDEQGRFLIANEAFYQLTRTVTPANFVGQTASGLFPPPVGLDLEADDLAVLRSGEAVVNREEPCRLTTEPDCWLATTKVPLRDPGDRVIGLVVISHDITERRRASRQLQAANDELLRANTELKEVHLQLLHLERLQSIGRLAAGVAHEVKNPLAVLRMGVDYVLSLPLPPTETDTAAKVFEDMETAIKRADTIIMGMLDFSAPGQLHLKPVAVNQLVNHALSLVRHELKSNGYVVERQLTPFPVFALLDAQKIDQVLVNLLTNAFHAMPDGGRLTLRTAQRTIANDETHHDAGSREGARFRPGEPVIEVQIDDTGHGIPPEKLDKIFDPFFTTKETGKGTGLGLTVARKIVELHGGSLEINNRPEGGVRSTLLFKAHKETA